MLNAPIVQTACCHHGQVRETLFGIAEHILNNSRTFDTRKGMFNFDTDAGDPPVVSFFGGS